MRSTECIDVTQGFLDLIEEARQEFAKSGDNGIQERLRKYRANESTYERTTFREIGGVVLVE